MSKANQYHLHFRVIAREDGSREPYIDTDTDASGSTINSEVANFMLLLGIRLTQSIIAEIYGCDPFSTSNNGYSIIGSFEETVEIYSPPARAVFNSGGDDVVIPLQDFIDILNEWKAFLNSLPYRHTLSDR